MKVLHLCISLRQLLIALLDHCASKRETTIVCLVDYQPLADETQARLQSEFPEICFFFINEAEQIATFATWPLSTIQILKRNLALKNARMVRPWQWRPTWLDKEDYSIGYLYHSGPFMAKVLSGACKNVVLREDGLANYLEFKVSRLKSVVRYFFGMNPSRQVWGEETWIDCLEVERPEDVPLIVRGKAKTLKFADLMRKVPRENLEAISSAFQLSTTNKNTQEKTAVIFTQPIAQVGYCDANEEMHDLYQSIVDNLHNKNYEVFIKPHPKDDLCAYNNAAVLPKDFPAELLACTVVDKYDVAIALFSTAIVGSELFAKKRVQLIEESFFKKKFFHQWEDMAKKKMLDL